MRREALKAEILALELGRSERRMLPLGLPEVDAALQGGLDLGVLHEVAGPAAVAFAELLARRQGGPVFWLAPEGAEAVCYPPGLLQYGTNPSDLTFLRLPTTADLLRAAYEVLASSAVGTALLELPAGLSLTAMRRLQIAAQKGGGLGLFLNSQYLEKGGQAGGLFGSAMTRWHVRARNPQPDHLRLELHLTKNRRGRPCCWTVETHHATHHLHLVALSGERAADPPRA
ncbi:MAG: hypothetical protein EP348_06590 [Alphaproteobacteria bacterium]|nr:MAG: hypothetical protein EP348_06590 [Alphaproteobacteria bacterium]